MTEISRSTASVSTVAASSSTPDFTLGRRLSGICLVLGPLFLLLSYAVLPPLKMDEAAQLVVIGEHPTRYYLFIALGIAATVLLLPAVLALMELVRVRRHSRPAHVGGLLALAGLAISLTDLGGELVKWQMALPGADPEEMVGLNHRVDTSAGVMAIFQLAGLAIIVGFVMLAIASVRSGVAPRWVGVCLSVGILVNLVAFAAASVAALVVSGALILIGFGWVALTYFFSRSAG